MDSRLWMARDLVLGSPDQPLGEAGALMARHRVRHLLIVDPPGSRHLVGVLSSHDLYRASDADLHPFSPQALDRITGTVGAAMTHAPFAIAPDTSIAAAARILRDRKFGCLPVVERGELVGVLTEHDLLRAFLSLSGADQPGYEVTALAPDGSDVLGSMVALAGRHRLTLTSANVFAHEGKRYALCHFVGAQSEAFVDALWRSGQTILRVRTSAAEPGASPAPPLGRDRQPERVAKP